MNSPRLIFKNTMAQTVANLLNRFGNLLIVFIMARTLHASGVGIYATAVAYFALIDEATNMGASTYLIREIARQPDITDRFVVNFGLVGAVFSLLGLAVFYAILPHLGYGQELMLCIYLIALAVLPGTFIAIQNSVFVAHQRVEFITLITLVSTLTNILGSAFLLLNQYGVASLVAWFVVVQYLVMLLGLYLINHNIASLHWKFDYRFARHMVWDIRTFALLSILGGLMSQPEVIILSLLASEQEVGYFSAALRVAYLWLFISQIFMNNVYPVLSRSFYQADQQFQAIQAKAIKYLLVVSLPLAAGMIAAAKPITHLLYGAGFEDAIQPLQILSIGLPLAFVGAVLWRSLAARNQQDLVLGTRLVSLVTRLGGGYLLIYFWHGNGAAVSATFNLLLTAGLLAYFLHRFGVATQFWGLSWRLLLASVCMGLLPWVLSPLLSLWLLVPLAGLAYVALAWLLRVFSPDDYAIIRTVWRPRLAEKR